MVSATARAKVRARVEAAMTSQVRVLRGKPGVLDPQTGAVGGLRNATVIYQGKARVKTITGEGTVVVGAGEIDTQQVIISIPVNAPVPNRDDIVVVDGADAADVELPGRAFRVMEVQGGSLFGDCRPLSCTAWHPNQFWGEQ